MTASGLFMLSIGLAIFLLGMKLLSSALQTLAGGNLHARLSRAAGHPVQGVCVGAAMTAVLQSSSALTVFLVGLTGAGALSLEAAAVLLMGANIGTTLSPWVLGLLGLSPRESLLRPELLCPLLALWGLILLPAKRTQLPGRGLLGLSLLLWGMHLMQGAALLMPRLTQLSPDAAHPFRGVLMGTVATGILQSSAGAVGLLQALCASGTLPLGSVIPLLIGLNLGTCVTALLASLGAGADARRVAVIHISFNALGGIIWLAGMTLFSGSGLLCQPSSPVSVAVIHSLFNLSTTAILLPLRRYLVRLAVLCVPGRTTPQKTAPLP